MSQDNPAYAAVGGDFVEGRPVALALHRQRDARGVVPRSRGRRKEWWWEPGPVDSVVFCWDLDMGVGIMAAFELIGGIRMFGSIGYGLAADTSTVVTQALEEEFARDCKGLEILPYKCERLINRILELTRADDILVLKVTAAAVSLMLGWLGLRAWWCYDPRAAKFNLWLLPMRPLMAVVMTGIQVTTEMSYGRHPEWGVYLLLGLLLWVLPWMYCSKVMWSYHLFLLRRSSGTTREAAMVELDASSPSV